MKILETYVAGIFYNTDVRILNQNIYIGADLELKLEENNQFDRNAIGIYFQDNKIGYIPSSCNKDLANKIREGGNYTAAVKTITNDFKNYNITVNVYQTTDSTDSRDID